MKNKKPTIFFSSFKAQLFFVVGLLVVVFILILLNVYAGRFIQKAERNYDGIVEGEAQFLYLVSQESSALKHEKRFSGLMMEYSDLKSSCLQCHEEKSDLLNVREETLQALHGVVKESIVLQGYVQKRLQELINSVRYIHEHHIATLKNFSRHYQYQEEVKPVDRSFEKSDTRSAPELDIIKQVVIIQQSIFDMRAGFYSLNQAVDFYHVKQAFKDNLNSFYQAVNRFEDYSLDAQDGLLVEELLENGRVFQRSLDTLVNLLDKQSVFYEKLDENLENVVNDFGIGKQKLLLSRSKLNQKMRVLRIITFVIILFLFVVSFLKSRRIIRSITEVVRETGKIEKDFRYRIQDDPSIVSEFQVLTQALNSMAGKIEIRVQRLSEEIEQRITVEEKLSMEKERLAVTLKSIGDGVITTDITGRIVFINKVAEQLTGWGLEEVVGKPVAHVFNIINKKTGEPRASLVGEVVRQGKVIELADKMTLAAKDGTLLSIADSGAPIRDADNQIIGVVLVFRDVTRRLRMEDELLKMKKLQSLGVLAGGIAHDFNNILMAILANIQLAGRYIDKENKASELLADAGKASIRAQGLTQQLLTFSQGGHLVKKASSIDRLIKDSAGFVLRGSSVGCKYDFANDLWLADIDEGQMSQVIQNVTLNAGHAMAEGGEIIIKCENSVGLDQDVRLGTPQKEYVKITITDKGKGIAHEDLNKIFDPYFSTKNEGTGLGLAVSYSIVKKHDGHIQVESVINKGTTVTIYLPAVRGRALKSEVKPDICDDCRGTIMVMDDNEMVLRTITHLLRYMGYDVVCVKDGVQAIAEYKELYETDHPIDAIIMDLTIPGGMGGKEAVLEILKINEAAKVVVSSGYSEDPVLADYKKYGFQGAIVKPYELPEISRVFQEVLHS